MPAEAGIENGARHAQLEIRFTPVDRAMAIAPTVQRYLDEKGVVYQIRRHHHTGSAMESAYSAHVAPDSIAKGVLLRDGDEFLLAVLPADHTVDLDVLRYLTDRPGLALATEQETGDVFTDCALGAVPAIGPAYGLETWVDEAVRDCPVLYFEAGDHEELIYVEEPDFERLMEGAQFGSFARPGY